MSQNTLMSIALVILFLFLYFLAACASPGPVMPTEPFRCFDSDGHEIPCVDEMDCHEDETGSVKEQAKAIGLGCPEQCSGGGDICLAFHCSEDRK